MVSKKRQIYLSLDPIRLVRMVEKITGRQSPEDLIHHPREADGVGEIARSIWLTRHRRLHPDKLDGGQNGAFGIR